MRLKIIFLSQYFFYIFIAILCAKMSRVNKTLKEPEPSSYLFWTCYSLLLITNRTIGNLLTMHIE